MKTSAYTGKGASPYDDGIAYDRYEAKTGMYRRGAAALVRHLDAGQVVMDLGSGTGICTLEVLSQNPGVNVVGIEKSAGMIDVAKYKFHMGDMSADNAYWEKFRSESARYRGQVSFVQADIETVDMRADSAVANQSMHWTDINRAFENLGKCVDRVVWNSASHFFEDGKYPSLEYGFRYNDFLGYVLDEVSKSVLVRDYKELSRPEHDIETIKAIEGFETEQVETYLVDVDMEVFVKNHVPVFVRELAQGDVTGIVDEAIAKALANPLALRDTMHMYDIVPIFVSRKS